MTLRPAVGGDEGDRRSIWRDGRLSVVVIASGQPPSVAGVGIDTEELRPGGAKPALTVAAVADAPAHDLHPRDLVVAILLRGRLGIDATDCYERRAIGSPGERCDAAVEAAQLPRFATVRGQQPQLRRLLLLGGAQERDRAAVRRPARRTVRVARRSGVEARTLRPLPRDATQRAAPRDRCRCGRRSRSRPLGLIRGAESAGRS